MSSEGRSIFFLLPSLSTTTIPPNLKFVLLLLEKEFLGFYVTSHPLSSIRDKLPFLMTHKVSDIVEVPTDKMVTICGLITSVKQIPTKKDPSKFIKFITIEDLSGKIEVVCFSKKQIEYDAFLQPEQKVIISGKVSRRDEESVS